MEALCQTHALLVAAFGNEPVFTKYQTRALSVAAPMQDPAFVTDPVINMPGYDDFLMCLGPVRL